MSSATSLSTTSGFLPSISSPSSRNPAFNSLDDYVYELFNTALKQDKKLSQELLNDPKFGNKIVKYLPNESKNTPRIILLNILARKALGKFTKHDIANLIYEVGKSNYVASCEEDDIKALYKGLFSCIQTKNFSQTELLDFEHFTSEPLQSHIFKEILDHTSFAEHSIIKINDLACKHLKYLPKPHIRHLVDVIGNSDSFTENKVAALRSSVFIYPESRSFSQKDLINLAKSSKLELRPYILKWAILHESFLAVDASIEGLNPLTEEFEQAIDALYPSTKELENEQARIFKIEFLYSLMRHLSAGPETEPI